jgi:hypothetical protein
MILRRAGIGFLVGAILIAPSAFLNFSFLMMVGTVIINLVVGALDQQGRSELAQRVDHLCRWIFPLTYFGLVLFAFAVAFLLF